MILLTLFDLVSKGASSIVVELISNENFIEAYCFEKLIEEQLDIRAEKRRRIFERFV
jgi:hypothetical protein